MKKVVLSIAVLLISLRVYSQSVVPDTVGTIRFGIFIGPNYANLQSVNVSTTTLINNNFGYSLGVLMEYALSKHFSVSPETELSYNTSSVIFKYDNYSIRYSLYQVNLEFKGHLIYKTGQSKLRPYILAGPAIKFLMRGVGANPYISMDFGIGLEHYFHSFIFAPELRYSLGLQRITDLASDSDLKFNSISMVFNFK
ncbi:MAG TPA: outer membrane beta-barrel protein [Saprospiraceae bacterium]|nr:outer membrane beta-barrel protein [Saprospiraceae bacterium]